MNSPATTPAPRRDDFRFAERLRVRWAEVDLQQIVFNAHYLMYFDTAMAGYWRAMALPYQATLAGLGGDLYVRRATLDYEASARYDDVCEVALRCARIGTASLRFAAAVFRDGQRLVHGELVYVFADPATQTSRPVPAALRGWLEAFEDGAPMLELQQGGWALLGERAAALRREVLCAELGLPGALAEDGEDRDARHLLALNRGGRAVGTARLSAPDAEGTATVARTAVLRPLRGGGIGRALLEAAIHTARERGDRALRADVLASAAPFWRAAGFVDTGPMFVAGGQPHRPMRRAL